MKKYLFLLLISLSSGAQNFDAITKHKSFSANYSQERYISSSDIKLLSTGELEVVNGTKIIWKQLTPFEQTVILPSNEKNPIMDAIGDVLFKIFSGEIEELNKIFEIKSFSKNKIDISLNPKDELISKVVSEIHIKGGEYIHFFKMTEKSENSLIIKFDKFRSEKQ